MMQATFPVYFLKEAEAELEQLCDEFDFFPEIWEGVKLWLKKSPGHLRAKDVGGGCFLKIFPINYPFDARLFIVYKFDSASVYVVAIRLSPG